MYLSRVEIDLYNRKTLRDLGHLGCYHGWIEDSFPNGRNKSKAERSRKLWRIDTIKDKSYLLILSEDKPDFNSLEKYGVKGTATCKSYDEFLDSLKEGMRANFRIKLNTVKSIRDKDNPGKRGQLVPVPLHELNEFFMARTEKNGFTVRPDEFSIASRDEEVFVRHDDDKAKAANLKLVSATYEGILTITDLDKLKNALVSGIGKKKAYGFGFLTIIPIK